MKIRLTIVMFALAAALVMSGCCRIRKALTGSAPCMEKKQLEKTESTDKGSSCGG